MSRTFKTLLAVAAMIVVAGALLARRSPPPQPAAAPAQTSLAAAEPLAQLSTRAQREARQRQQQGLDPRQDGWDTEVVAEQAKQVLTQLATLLTHDRQIRAADVAPLAVPDVRVGNLRAAHLETAFEGAAGKIERSPESGEDPPAASGHAALVEALRALGRSPGGHAHVKVVRVEANGQEAETTAYFDLSVQEEQTTRQQKAVWRSRWRRNEHGQLLLTALSADDFQQSSLNGPDGEWFSDCTESVLGANASFRRQLMFGLNHWVGRVGRFNGMHVFARSGLAVGDVNGDGLDDLYVCQPGGLPNRLFVQNADGGATDQSAEAGVDWLDETKSALLVDLDNDGDQDLAVASSSGVILMANDGNGRFATRATLPPRDTDLHSLSAVDYDNDGDLDLYVCIDFSNTAARQNERSVGFVYHDANDGGANALFRNEISKGQWHFVDATAAAGLDEDNRRHSLAAAWEDYDNDGDQDLYVANDYGQNCLYQNEGGKFANVAEQAGVVDFGSGMSVTWGDYNRDGLPDLYVSNMFSSAGNRITRQSKFIEGSDEELRSRYTRFAKGNSLFQNLGGGRFQEVTTQANVEIARWAWSSLFADLNNDGWDDLVVANGYITTEDTGDL